MSRWWPEPEHPDRIGLAAFVIFFGGLVLLGVFT